MARRTSDDSQPASALPLPGTLHSPEPESSLTSPGLEVQGSLAPSEPSPHVHAKPGLLEAASSTRAQVPPSEPTESTTNESDPIEPTDSASQVKSSVTSTSSMRRRAQIELERDIELRMLDEEFREEQEALEKGEAAPRALSRAATPESPRKGPRDGRQRGGL